MKTIKYSVATLSAATALSLFTVPLFSATVLATLFMGAAIYFVAK